MSETPRLVNWANSLTNEGQALAAHLRETGATLPHVDAPRDSLVDPYARFFRSFPLEASELWAQFMRQQESV